MSVMPMPRRITAWACAWGCGRNVLTNHGRMYRHQVICNWNPENLACATCKHWHKEAGSVGVEPYEPGVSECLALKIDLAKELFRECPSWEAQEKPATQEKP